MIKIVNVSINRYRSILSLELPISADNNLVALCGKNNVGKTNTLRAMKVFFKPEDFDATMDIPKIKHATGGQSVYPKIEIVFWDSSTSRYYAIIRDMKEYADDKTGLSGYSYELNKKKKVDKEALAEEEAAAAAAAAAAVVPAATVAGPVPAAAEQDDKNEDDPGAAVVTVETTHYKWPPFPIPSPLSAGVSSISYYVDD